MVIQTRIHDGISVKTRTYRKVRNIEYTSIKLGFYLQRNFCKWGQMIELKGDKQTILAKFGNSNDSI